MEHFAIYDGDKFEIRFLNRIILIAKLRNTTVKEYMANNAVRTTVDITLQVADVDGCIPLVEWIPLSHRLSLQKGYENETILEDASVFDFITVLNWVREVKLEEVPLLKIIKTN